MVLEILLVLFVSLVILAFSARIIISNSITLARYFGISELALGFILVSVATSLPELLVSLFSGYAGETGLAVGNVFGSNIANICIVIGLAVLLGNEIVVKRKDMKDLVQILFLVSFIPIVMLLFPRVTIYGIILLLSFVIYVYYIMTRGVGLESKDGARISRSEGLQSAFLFLASLIVVVVSSNYVVDSAVLLAGELNLAKVFLGSTIVAIGTSLPEIAVSLSAIARRKISLAIGNVIGSSITNLTLVLGAAAILNPIAANISIFANIVLFSIAANLLVWNFLSNGRRITKKNGIALLVIYLLFVLTTAGIEIAI